MPIYTKKGDAGETGLANGDRVAKSDPIIEILGHFDELNSSLGLAVSYLPEDSQLNNALQTVQSKLFAIGSFIASKQEVNLPLKEEEIISLEKQIDIWWQQLPPLKNFILPGGNQAASATHLSRAICRRTERLLIRSQIKDPILLKWFNRLSDYLFAAARFANFESNIKEIIVNNDVLK